MSHEGSRTGTQLARADRGLCSCDGGVGGFSRRSIFAPHAADPSVMRRCPICQWAVEEDHAEALRLSSVTPRAMDWPDVSAEDLLAAGEEAVVGFSLV